MATDANETYKVVDVSLNVRRMGEGAAALVLHGLEPFGTDTLFLRTLAAEMAIYCPTHPGFAGTSRPDDFDTVYDLVQLYISALKFLPEKPLIIGCSFGGWLAAEIAAKCSPQLAGLVLVDALGVKLSPPSESDILDIFNCPPDLVAQARWYQPDQHVRDFDRMPDEDIISLAQSQEALCLYAWEPYMYNPQLPRWLNAIGCPTLVLWGEKDGIASPEYGWRYAQQIPGAIFEIIPKAAHHPEIEQPEELAQRITRFATEHK